MRAHPDALRGDVAQQGVEAGTVSTVLDRVDPDQHAIHSEQLLADGVREALVVNRWLSFDADGIKRREHVGEATSFRGGLSTGDGIASREDGNAWSG
ncbi:hypothetical protein GCM10010987_71060 [Bradyrhizobium guangdongense]|uniref:Uncharacterized protein n=1 Tax=Bradyrhizobium guangdongense TaxID=1325090 RepID=A0AA87WFA4_9BRAD|nr:hypothetical protein GCM10010987_71060 [Bradyrhizobium guangdongense]